jgi:hypothetical protein
VSETICRHRPGWVRASIVAAAAAALFVSAPALAYRTAHDLPALAGTERVRFEQNDIRFAVFDQVPSGLDPFQVSSAIVEASQTWMAPSCSALRFVYDGTTRTEAKPGDGVSTVQWVPNWNERGFNPQAAGATDVQYEKVGETWVIAEADMYLNGQFQWTAAGDETPGVRDVRTVATHEFGHVLGLLHPCEPGGDGGAPDCSTAPDYASACMYPIYGAGEAHLSSDDIAGLCYLYAGPRCDATGCPEGQQCTDRGCQPLCHGQVCADEERCTLSGCQRPSDCIDGCSGARCAADGDCGNGQRCTAGVCAVAESLDEPKPMGATCASSDSCRDGYCLVGAGDEPLCTRACGPDLPECPSYWSCELAAEKRVCAPQSLQLAGGGCSINPVPPHTVLPALAFAFLAMCSTRSFRRCSKEKQV